MALTKTERNKRYEEKNPDQKEKMKHARGKSSCKSFLKNHATNEELIFFKEYIDKLLLAQELKISIDEYEEKEKEA